MAISVPSRWRSPFRREADHFDGLSRKPDRHRRNSVANGAAGKLAPLESSSMRCRSSVTEKLLSATDATAVQAHKHAPKVRPPRQRLSCVLGMLSSLGV